LVKPYTPERFTILNDHVNSDLKFAREPSFSLLYFRKVLVLLSGHSKECIKAVGVCQVISCGVVNLRQRRL